MGTYYVGKAKNLTKEVIELLYNLSRLQYTKKYKIVIMDNIQN